MQLYVLLHRNGESTTGNTEVEMQSTIMVKNSSLKTFPLGHSMLENNNKKYKLFPRWSCMRTNTLLLCFPFTLTLIPHSPHLEHQACVVLRHTKQFSDTSQGPSNWTESSHCAPEDSIRSHRVRTQSTRLLRPPPTSEGNCKAQVIWPTSYKAGFPQLPWVYLLECLTELRETYMFINFLYSKAVVPNLFDTRDQFHGRQFFQGWEVGDGLGMIQAHYIFCALYFCYYYIEYTIK